MDTALVCANCGSGRIVNLVLKTFGTICCIPIGICNHCLTAFTSPTFEDENIDDLTLEEYIIGNKRICPSCNKGKIVFFDEDSDLWDHMVPSIHFELFIKLFGLTHDNDRWGEDSIKLLKAR